MFKMCYSVVINGTFYRPQRKLRKGNVFTGVCLFKGRCGVEGVWCRGMSCRECLPKGWCLHRGYLPGGICLGVSAQGVPAPDMVTTAGGTYPTGMHTCLKCFSTRLNLVQY